MASGGIELKVGVDKRVVQAALQRVGSQVAPALQKVTIDHGYRALALIRRNASGRPGPNAPTGDYKRTWAPSFGADGSVTLGTNAPQARRLEKGFTGEDSLGRLYNQRAFPHVAPAEREIGPQYRRAVTVEIRRLLKAAK